ncbi:MAG: hypothetical protein JW751_24765 [Polyangiaceae bacterium]|nr:hypothetical protein [Polyangiaceae bacterium]
MRHVWEVDVSTCTRCGGPMKWVEVATEPHAIARVLAELEPSDEDQVKRAAPPHRRSRPPEQLGFGFR